MGIAPWSGSLSADGLPTWPLGKIYYQFSQDGLSKELGYVGGYGEILNWMVHLYEATGERGLTDTRDPLVRAQMLKILHARSHFRYPTSDNEGYAVMRGESVIGWRDHAIIRQASLTVSAATIARVRPSWLRPPRWILKRWHTPNK